MVRDEMYLLGDLKAAALRCEVAGDGGGNNGAAGTVYRSYGEIDHANNTERGREGKEVGKMRRLTTKRLVYSERVGEARRRRH